jgi:NAD(P)H-hydrate epimerase
VKTELRRLWQESESAVVVDASALDWLPKGLVNEGALRVMTPHPGEAARMLECSVLEVQSKRLWALRELSARYGGCWVVLKGHQTLVGKVDGPVWVNPSGNPTMAQGGAGDVLAGLLVGLLAQPRLRQDVCRTLRWGVWRHGFAADGLGERELGWTVEDLAGVV